MKKTEVILKTLGELDLNYMTNQIDLYLENNYDKKCMDLFSYINSPKSDFSEEYPYRKLTLREARELKWYYIKSVESFLHWYLPIEVSRTTLIKSCKTLDFFKNFNTYYINLLNGEDENIETFKRVLKIK